MQCYKSILTEGAYNRETSGEKNCLNVANVTQTIRRISLPILGPHLINRVFVWTLLLAADAVPYEIPGRTGQRNWTWGLFELDLSGFLSYDHLASTSFSQTETLGLLHKRTMLKFGLFNLVLNLEIYFDRLKSFRRTNTAADSGQHGNEILIILTTAMKFNTNSLILDPFKNVQIKPHSTSGFCLTLIKMKDQGFSKLSLRDTLLWMWIFKTLKYTIIK